MSQLPSGAVHTIPPTPPPPAAAGHSTEPTPSVAGSALDSISVVARQAFLAESLHQVGGKLGQAAGGTVSGGRKASPGPVQPEAESSRKDTNVPRGWSSSASSSGTPRVAESKASSAAPFQGPHTKSLVSAAIATTEKIKQRGVLRPLIRHLAYRPWALPDARRHGQAGAGDKADELRPTLGGRQLVQTEQASPRAGSWRSRIVLRSSARQVPSTAKFFAIGSSSEFRGGCAST